MKFRFSNTHSKIARLLFKILCKVIFRIQITSGYFQQLFPNFSLRVYNLSLSMKQSLFSSIKMLSSNFKDFSIYIVFFWPRVCSHACVELFDLKFLSVKNAQLYVSLNLCTFSSPLLRWTSCMYMYHIRYMKLTIIKNNSTHMHHIQTRMRIVYAYHV